MHMHTSVLPKENCPAIRSHSDFMPSSFGCCQMDNEVSLDNVCLPVTNGINEDHCTKLSSGILTNRAILLSRDHWGRKSAHFDEPNLCIACIFSSYI
ncbi:hypothetical protein AAG906_028619 [Vitis piasezkii]